MGLVGHEEPVEVAGQKPGRSRLIRNNVHDVFAVEVSGIAQEGLLPVVVVLGFVLELPMETAVGIAGNLGGNGPSGEGPGCLLDIVLRVVSDPEGEELQKLPAPVFVNGPVMISVVVQPEDHGRRLCHLHQQVTESAQSVFTEDGNLAGHLRWIVHLGVAGGEQLMPEEGHLLFQRPLGVDHPEYPIGLINRRRPGPLITREVTVQQFFIYGRLQLWMQKLLDHGFVAFGDTLLQYFTGITETRASHQVGHQSNIFLVGHHHLSAYRGPKH